jgi:hypothetical protein
MNKKNIIIYWTSTILLALGMFSGGLAQLLRVRESVAGVVHIGYPLYFLSIIGIWKILGVVVILTPKLPLLKEWAYAGFFFAMTGALISHIAAGDGFPELVAPLIFALLAVVSWYFRPESKKLIPTT